MDQQQQEHLIHPPGAVRSSGRPYKEGDHTTIGQIVYRVTRVDSTGVYAIVVPPRGFPQKG